MAEIKKTHAFPWSYCKCRNNANFLKFNAVVVCYSAKERELLEELAFLSNNTSSRSRTRPKAQPASKIFTMFNDFSLSSNYWSTLFLNMYLHEFSSHCFYSIVADWFSFANPNYVWIAVEWEMHAIAHTTCQLDW